MSAPIEVTGLVKRFGEVTALDRVDFAVADGAVHGLLGPNGAGKSTLLRCLFGLVRPDEGRVALFGHEHHLDGPAAALDGVAGFVDRPRFYPYLSARRSLTLLARADGIGAESAADEVLDRVGLADVGRRRVSGWSTGMLQRLGIAAALLRRPQLLILDEPTEGLDPTAAREVVELVRSLATDGVTVLFSSHDIAEVDDLCDSVTILRRGRVAETAPLTQLRRSAPHGRHHLTTSDDEITLTVAGDHALRLTPHPRGGLSFEADPATLHAFVCDLGRRDVSVTMLEQEVAPLVALFHQLVGDRGTTPPGDAIPAAPLSEARP